MFGPYIPFKQRDEKGFAHPERIEKLVKNYSQFVSFPIYTWQEKGFTKEVRKLNRFLFLQLLFISWGFIIVFANSWNITYTSYCVSVCKEVPFCLYLNLNSSV